MRLRLAALDEEVRLAEQAIIRNRKAFEDSLAFSAQRARERTRAALSSPAFLLSLMGVGAMLGYLILGKRSTEAPLAATKKKSMWGVLGATAFSLAQARFGGPVGLAQWVLGKLSRHGAQAHSPAYRSAPVEF